MTNEIFNTVYKSNRKQSLIETDDGNEFVYKIFSELPNSKHTKRHSMYTSKGPIFAETFVSKIRDVHTEPVFKKGNANCFIDLPKVPKSTKTRSILFQ